MRLGPLLGCLQSGGATGSVCTQRGCNCLSHSPRNRPGPTRSVRAKRLLGIKNIDCYALALYVDPDVKGALGGKFAGAAPEQLAADQRLFDGAGQAAWCAATPAAAALTVSLRPMFSLFPFNELGGQNGGQIAA